MTTQTYAKRPLRSDERVARVPERRARHHRERHHADRADRPDMHADSVGHPPAKTHARRRPGSPGRRKRSLHAARARARHGGPQAAPARQPPKVCGAGRERQEAGRYAFRRDDPESERRPDSARTARPPGRTGPASRRARLGEPVAGEARRHASADQEDQHDDEAERRAGRNLGEPGRASSTWKATLTRASASTSPATLGCASSARRSPRAPTSAAKTTRNPASIAAAAGRPIAADAKTAIGRPPKERRAPERHARDRQPAGPVGDRGQKKAGDDGAAVAEDHLMRVPVDRRKGGRNRDRAGEDRRPQRHPDQRPDARGQKERTEAAAEQRRAAPCAGGARRNACLRGDAPWSLE